MTNPSLPLTHELIRSACSAPSVHNTQPWSWRVPDATTIELYADRNRQLQATDPRGRDLAISCGLPAPPDGGRPSIRPGCEVSCCPPLGTRSCCWPGSSSSVGHIETDSVAMLTALENRLSDRRGFSTWEVPDERLRHFCEAASEWGAHASRSPIPGPGTGRRNSRAKHDASRRKTPGQRGTGQVDRPLRAESVDDGIPLRTRPAIIESGTTHRRVGSTPHGHRARRHP